jgi:hypothetical protein
MNETDLDRLIDRAAAELIEWQPSRALRHVVSARIREPRRQARPRLLWGSAAMAAILCATLAIALMNRAPKSSVAGRDARLTPNVTSPSAMVEPSVPGDGQVASAVEPAPPVARATPRRAPRPTVVPTDLPSSIESLTPEPLVMPSIDLPPLESQAASVERIEMEELTIEPLTASND